MMLRATVYFGEYDFHLVDMSGFLFEDYSLEIYEKVEIKMCLEHDIHQEAGALSKTEIRGMYSPVLL